VWLAHNIGLDARVAIKLVHAERASELPTLRLEKEARAAARLGHPAVVRVFDFGRTVTGDAFIVMECLEGQSLGEKLFESGRLSPVEALSTLLPIADALVAAHARGIVHRDLKPENIFLSQNGDGIQPKLLDFGIAKLSVGPARHGGSITAAGALVGSPAYASPEQAACREDVGEHTDIWSFCVVLYECLTGKVPFDSDDYPELFRQIGHEPPESILEHGVGDLELWKILQRGLAKSPAERWPTMLVLGRALAQWLRAHGIREDISGVVLESKWLPRTHSDPVAAMSDLEPSSFVRRVERHPALATTEHARKLPRIGRYTVLGTTALGALAGLAYGIVELESQRPPVLVGVAPPSLARWASAKPLSVAPTFGSGPSAPAPSAPAPSAPAPSAVPKAAADEHAHVASPRPEASDSSGAQARPPEEPKSEPKGDLLNPY
jgi:serine/threonine-protein kinase